MDIGAPSRPLCVGVAGLEDPVRLSCSTTHATFGAAFRISVAQSIVRIEKYREANTGEESCWVHANISSAGSKYLDFVYIGPEAGT